LRRTALCPAAPQACAAEVFSVACRVGVKEEEKKKRRKSEGVVLRATTTSTERN
jgi:hypothetical protein